MTWKLTCWHIKVNNNITKPISNNCVCYVMKGNAIMPIIINRQFMRIEDLERAEQLPSCNKEHTHTHTLHTHIFQMRLKPETARTLRTNTLLVRYSESHFIPRAHYMMAFIRAWLVLRMSFSFFLVCHLKWTHTLYH